MTLRSRLLSGLALVLALLVALAVLVVVRQRAQLIAELDERLEAIAPLDRPQDSVAVRPLPPPKPPVGPDGSAGREEPGTIRRPISEVYIATVPTDGSIEVIQDGQLLDDVPDLTSFAGVVTDGRSFTTVGSVGGDLSFRILLDPPPDTDGTAVIAVPMTDVDRTIDQLIAAFVVVITLAALTLGAVAWWVIRLGLQPVTDMTETAEAISSGARRQRAPEPSNATEAGRLARSFNSMLDQRDEAEDRLRRFVSDASHELRTPLTSIQGYLEVYADGGFRKPGQLDDAVRRMRAESDRMARLVDDLLRLARLDEEQPLALVQTDVGELVRDVCADAATAHPGREVTADAPRTGSLMATVDGQKLQQVLSGLVDNAIVYGPDAVIHLEAEEEPGQVVISVADDGPGLTAEEAERVFDRFYQGDASRSRRIGGSGLGLSIAKAIVDSHGGSIDLDTAPGEGCRFTVRLPTGEPARTGG